MPETQFNSQLPWPVVPSMASRALIDLFSIPPTPAVHLCEMGDTNHQVLWASDALHRANNLAQMSSSLESRLLRQSFGLQDESLADGARALSLAYAELGAHSPVDQLVPCAPLLETIATGLVALFSGDRSVALGCSLDAVALPAEQRRALVLIASELVINALKHAFPSGGGGVITVALIQRSEGVELRVADDGAGFVPRVGAGEGSGLMRRFALLLNADIEHRNDGGLSAVVVMPSWGRHR